MAEPVYISIIVPAYNAANSIRNCLDRLLLQDFKNFEIIVEDGNSSDETVMLVKEYSKKDERISIFSEKDNGIYDAINKGIRHAKGQWIYIIGSDDLIADEKVLGKIYAALSKSASPIVYGNVRIKGNAGWAKDGDIYDGEFDLKKLVTKNICQQAVFYRRNIFDEQGMFNPEYKVCADWDFLLRVSAKYSTEYIPLLIADFFGGGTSAVKRDLVFEKDFIPNFLNYFGKRICNPEFGRYKLKFREQAGIYFRKGLFSKAWRCFSAYRVLKNHSQ